MPNATGNLCQLPHAPRSNSKSQGIIRPFVFVFPGFHSCKENMNISVSVMFVIEDAVINKEREDETVVDELALRVIHDLLNVLDTIDGTGFALDLGATVEPPRITKRIWYRWTSDVNHAALQ